MTSLTLATTASAAPMGPQVYEEQVAGRAPDVLGPGWHVRRAVVRSVRSSLPGNRRLPFDHLSTAPAPVRRSVGRILYPPSDLVHRMDLTLPPAPHEVITIHDIVAWRFNDEARPTPHASDESRRAAAVICPSTFAAEQAMEFLGVIDPYVVPNGVDDQFLRAVPATREALGDLGVPPGPFLLHAGGASLRKNLESLAGAWPTVRHHHPDVNLVMSGPPHPRRDELFGSLDGIVRLGRIAAGLVPGLMAAARAVVVPSLYEGFGLPALEAMAAGTVVVAANTSSLPEVCGDAAILVPPSVDGLTEGLLAVLADGLDRDAVIARGRSRASLYTWERSAQRHAEVWRRFA